MNKQAVVMSILALAIGAGMGYWFALPEMQSSSQATEAEKKPLFYRSPMDPTITSPVPATDSMGMDYVPVFAEAPEAEKKILFYRNAMNPTVTSPVPAKDSMGMDYVAVYDEATDGDVAGMVKIDPVVVQNIGVRVQKAVRKSFGRSVRASGIVDFNEQKMALLHPRVEGWIEQVFIDKTGETVKENEPLLSIYSPKLVATQQEYILALKNQAVLAKSDVEEIRNGAMDLTASARERLVLLDVPEHQIKALEKTKKIKRELHVHSPVAGTVIRIGSRKGQYVSPKTQLYMIVDLSEVWVYANVYDYELSWIREGSQVDMTLASVPGRTFTGRVEYIYPYAQSNTRTTRVRMVFKNADKLLRPEMLADIVIQADVQAGVIVVPSESVIRSGIQTQIFVQRAPGKFEPRFVTLGAESLGEVIVLDGIDEGDIVVTSGQFLLDSESKLKEATAKMLETLNEKAKSSQNKEAEMQDDMQGDMKENNNND